MILGLAAYRITRLLVHDTILDPVRDRLLARWPGEFTVFDGAEVEEVPAEEPGVRRVRSTGVRVTRVEGQNWIALRPTWFGRLVECPWCTGFWVSVVVVGVFWLVGPVWLWWLTPWAVAAVAGLLARLDT